MDPAEVDRTRKIDAVIRTPMSAKLALMLWPSCGATAPTLPNWIAKVKTLDLERTLVVAESGAAKT